jgi:hypothetical protein
MEMSLISACLSQKFEIQFFLEISLPNSPAIAAFIHIFQSRDDHFSTSAFSFIFTTNSDNRHLDRSVSFFDILP